MAEVYKGYVVDADGCYYVQMPDDSNQWGFTLYTDDQGFPGGIGIDSWSIVPDDEVPEEVKEGLGWILELD